jgi:hypothetical protein
MVMKRQQVDLKTLAGWAGVGLSTSLGCFWAFWGSIENFHEGWYYPDLGQNLLLMFVQYLSPMLIFILLAVAAVAYPRLGAVAHLVFGAFLSIIFRNAGIITVLGVPLLLIAALYWVGRVQPRKFAFWLVIGLPLVTAIAFAVGPAYQVMTRVDDGYRGMRLVEGNGVRLVWAPAGPGWPAEGVNWFDAVKAVERLSADGTRVEDSATHIWRLPTLDEVVRSFTRHGENVGGTMDSTGTKPILTIRPDKETPLWDRYSKIIYWWTGTEKDSVSAYLAAYNGTVFSQKKKFGAGYYGFRAVREPLPGDSMLTGPATIKK